MHNFLFNTFIHGYFKLYFKLQCNICIILSPFYINRSNILHCEDFYYDIGNPKWNWVEFLKRNFTVSLYRIFMYSWNAVKQLRFIKLQLQNIVYLLHIYCRNWCLSLCLLYCLWPWYLTIFVSLLNSGIYYSNFSLFIYFYVLILFIYFINMQYVPCIKCKKVHSVVIIACY